MTTTAPRAPHRVRIGTIVWGALLLVVAVFSILGFSLGSLGSVGLLWAIVGFGTILVLGAIAAGITRAARRPQPMTTASDGATPTLSFLTTPVDDETDEDHPPIG